VPILRKEPDCYPENLFEMSIEEAPWEIAHLRSRQEKVVARLLREARKPFYLPLLEQKRVTSGRTLISHLPLFPGYIFMRRVPGLRETLWRTSAVANLLEVRDQKQLTAELQQIHRLQQRGAVLTPRSEIAPGDAVRIREGAFAGYEGIVIEERGSLRLIVSVSILQKSVAVEFLRDVVAPLKAGAKPPAPQR
jgi:transcriptional antiterminator RfaH